MDDGLFLCKVRVYVPDRPGSLAKIAGYFADYNINISYFYYNRSEHPNRVLVEGKSGDNIFRSLYQDLLGEGFFRELFQEDLQITTPDNILKVSAYLENKPGTLADFASILKGYDANVTYMVYNEMISENRAEIAFYVEDPREISELARELNDLGYHYNLEYSGADEESDRIIGLNLVEMFYFKLREILDDKEVDKIKELVNTSKRLSDTLLRFNREAGRNLEAGQVFGNILALAISSRTKMGGAFQYRRLPSLPVGDVLLHAFRPPTGGNIYLLECDGDLVMIDGSYGIYYDNVKVMLDENGLDPSRVDRIYISHADADHAGLSGYFQGEYGSKVFMHPSAKNIIMEDNRAAGSKTPLLELNHYFTVLVNHFTECKFPETWQAYKTKKEGEIGEFPIIDDFKVGDLHFKVLESLGGHIPGQVFFLSEDAGLLFTADYLLYVPSLEGDERRFLNIQRFLMTSTNANSMLFHEEMRKLEEVAKKIDEKTDRGLLILPGHGDYYPIRLAP
ncbi:amino acid-binding ACT domain protein [Methanothermobacter sp. MT-2]|nr:amino acid-binding ACT domain protein [Methanothermobacter sp. MT-2]